MSKYLLWDIEVDSDTFKVFTLVDKSLIFEISEMFSQARKLADTWTPIELNFSLEKDQENKLIADFMRGFTVPVISINGCNVLGGLFKDHVEFLSLKTPVNEYFAINVRPIDCLDVASSIVVRGPRTGKITSIERYAFKWDLIDSVHMFRVSELGLSRLFVSDMFRNMYERNRLTGLIFHSVSMI